MERMLTILRDKQDLNDKIAINTTFRAWDKIKILKNKSLARDFDDKIIKINKNTTFRAWDKIEEKMINPVNIKNIDISNNDRLVITQYTGYKDTKGKKIYEGDIVSKDYDKGNSNYGLLHLVVFYQGSFGYIFDEDEESEKFKDFEPLEINKEVYVEGNVYENPELID